MGPMGGVARRREAFPWRICALTSVSSALPRRSRDVESLGEVVGQVLRILTAGAQADEALGHGVAAPARAPLSGRMDTAETGGLDHEPARPEKALGMGAALQREADDGAEAPHLARGDLMRGIVWQTRVAQAPHLGPRSEELSNRQRVRALPLLA